MADLDGVLKRLDPDELEEPADSHEEDLARLRHRWPHPIPDDHLAFLRTYGFYNGGLIRDGDAVVDQHRVFDVETILEEYDWFEDDLDLAGLLPVGGQDAWRTCLTPAGRYVEVEMGSGDIVAEYRSSTLSDVLDAIIDDDYDLPDDSLNGQHKTNEDEPNGRVIPALQSLFRRLRR